MYIFPGQSSEVQNQETFSELYLKKGLGLGSILSKATSVTDSMVEASSLGLADSLTDEERSLGLIYPRIERSALPTIAFGL